MSRWGPGLRLVAAAIVAYYTGQYSIFLSQVAQEEARRKRNSQIRQGRRDFNAAQKDRLEMVDVVPSAPRTLCLGRVRHVEGVRRRWVSGVHSEVATLIVSFAGHEIDGYEQWYLDDLPVKLDVDGWVQETSFGTGSGYTTNTTGYAIGATSIGLISGTGTIANGDTVRFNGDSTYYTVGTGIAAPGTLVLAGAGLQKALPASAVAVELVKTPFAKATREQIYQDAIFNSGTINITLSEPPLLGSVIVTTSGFNGESRDNLILSEGESYTVSGSVVSITSSPYADIHIAFTSGKSIKSVRIRPYLGTASQNVGADIASEYPGKIKTTDKFAGIACAVIDFVYFPDVFPQGFPQVAPVFRGAKCYDPRLDSTVPGGSGSHRAATPSTWAFSENPALHARRYATWSAGWALRAGDFSEADVIAAANVCDVSTGFTLTMTGGGTRTVTLPRHRSGITIPSDADHAQSMAAILSTMAGRDGWAGGVWRFRSGTLKSTAAAIDTSWLMMGLDEAGDPDGEAVISAVQALPREQRVNRVTGKCIDPVQRYQALPYPAIEDAVLIADKGERPIEVDFLGVNHIAHAQHLASIAIREAQAGTRLELRTGIQGLELELFDVVTVTHPRSGMAAKTFEVTGSTLPMGSMGQPIKLNLAEITAELFTPQSPLRGQDPAPDSTLRRPWQVAQLGALTVTSGTTALSDSGSILTRTKIAWPAASGENVRQGGEIEVQYHDASLPVPAGDWPIWTEQGNSTFAVIPGLQAGYVYLFRARAVQKLPLVRGQWTAVVAHKVAAVRGTKIFRQASSPTGDVQDGDEWFDTDDGNRYYVRAGGAWVAMPDLNKITTFVQASPPTASAIGDLWLDSDDGNKIYRWNGSAWASVRDAGIATALLAAADAQATADGKIDTFWQASPPGGAVEGDIWFDTDDGYKQYRFTSGVWVLAADTRIGTAISNAATAQATADGKVRTFVGTAAPTAEALGDLWLDTDDGNKLYRWSGTAWVALPVGTGAIAPGASTEVFEQNTAGPVTVSTFV